MRTNVVIDDELMSEALQLSGLPTKKAVIDEALRTFVRLKLQEGIRSLRGQLHWEGDLEAMRMARFLAEDASESYDPGHDSADEKVDLADVKEEKHVAR